MPTNTRLWDLPIVVQFTVVVTKEAIPPASPGSAALQGTQPQSKLNVPN